MNTVLIIEDDKFKATSLEKFMIERDEFDQVINVTSLVEAIDAIEADEYSFILVDMAIPSHPIKLGEGSPISLLTGGLEVLMELSNMERKDPCVVITQFPDIEIAGQFYPLAKAKSEIKKQLECSVLACLEYKEGESLWKESLKEILDNEYINTRR
ncbi:response regulator [Pseudoalteromonas translucida]|uniref:Orphan protein n=1 Tax=Pseudoalteromonas translucida (strain TAC 125) TaxID=326442 RepID=Q3IHZ5_PSET1|nr:response regulator [Pseudoalteromonas translucida]CAI87403.1 putative orphan protein [Pseudoalteromonas translucida]